MSSLIDPQVKTIRCYRITRCSQPGVLTTRWTIRDRHVMWPHLICCAGHSRWPEAWDIYRLGRYDLECSRNLSTFAKLFALHNTRLYVTYRYCTAIWPPVIFCCARIMWWRFAILVWRVPCTKMIITRKRQKHRCHSNGWQLNRLVIENLARIQMFGRSALCCGSCFHSAKSHIRAWMPTNHCSENWKMAIAWKSQNTPRKICKFIIQIYKFVFFSSKCNSFIFCLFRIHQLRHNAGVLESCATVTTIVPCAGRAPARSTP